MHGRLVPCDGHTSLRSCDAPALHRRLFQQLVAAPSALAVALGFSGVVYLVGSFVALCVPAWSATLDPLYGVAFLSELGFALWLVTRGVTLNSGSSAQATQVAAS